MSFVRLENVSVEFPIYQGSSRSLKKLLLASSTRGNLARDARDRINVRALNDVSFELRSGDRFALVYRIATFVISRFGVVGTRGQWRVVEYPTSSAASHAYAKECSRFVSEGYSDYRD